MPDASSRAAKLVAERDRLKADRANYENLWQLIAELVIPRRADFTVHRTPGTARTEKLFDSTAIWANEQLAGGLHGMLTSPAMPWFALEPRDASLMDNHEVRLWLEQVEREMNAEFNDPATGFHTAAHELYLDEGAFGTGCMFVEGVEHGGAHTRFSTMFLGDVTVGENALGNVDRMYRSFTYTAPQAADRWGQNKLPEAMKAALEKEPTKPFTILHCVKPYREYDETMPPRARWAYVSAYLLEQSKEIISESGFDEFPFIVPRWERISGEVYGRSPAMVALPDIRMVNQMAKTVIKAAQKVVDPPMQAPDDGFIGPAVLDAGKINYYRAGTRDRIEPVQTGGDIRLGEEELDARRKAIIRAFHVDRINLPGAMLPGGQNPYMSATETIQRREEMMLTMGPIVSRMQSEFLSPLIARVFAILLRAKALPPPPDAITGQRLNVRFVGPMAQSQRQSETGNIVQWFGLIAPLGDRDSTVWDVLDSDEFTRQTADLYRVPPSMLRSPQRIAAIRDARSQRDAQQQGIEQGALIARGLKDASAAFRPQQGGGA